MVKKVVKSRLAELESVIDRDLQCALNVGAALLEIKNSKLYKETHDRFEDYLKERFKLSKSRGYQLITAQETLNDLQNVHNVDKITSESQLREIAKVPEEQRGNVIDKATAAAGGKAPSAKQLADAAKSVIDPEDETEWELVDDTEDQDEFEDEPDLEVVDQDKPSTASIVRDHLDREVPLHLRDAYSRGQELDSLGRQLDKIKSEAKRLAALPGSNHLPIQEVELNCKLLKDLIQQARYWTACPRCDGKGCSRCQESGFLSLNKKSSLSKADKQVLGV